MRGAKPRHRIAYRQETTRHALGQRVGPELRERAARRRKATAAAFDDHAPRQQASDRSAGGLEGNTESFRNPAARDRPGDAEANEAFFDRTPLPSEVTGYSRMAPTPGRTRPSPGKIRPPVSFENSKMFEPKPPNLASARSLSSRCRAGSGERGTEMHDSLRKEWLIKPTLPLRPGGVWVTCFGSPAFLCHGSCSIEA
jgi:hypothetical protein